MSVEIPSLRLSELTLKINQTIEASFASQSFWVKADITNYTYKAQQRWHFFDLVEKDPQSNAIIAKLSCKAWGNGSSRISNFEKQTGQKFDNNIHVLINVSISFHAIYGLSLTINDVDTTFTLGLLEQQKQATLEKLVADNPSFIQKIGDQYITRNSQLPFNIIIQNIAVVSSKTSAGWQDFRHTLENNTFGYKFYVDDYFTAVQGDNNAGEMLNAIISVFQSQKKYDVLVITRGGGSQTDFLIFDNYNVGRAVAKFPIPIITGIGHQKNETIVDLMAHTQMKTPTKAAEFIIAHNKAFEDALLSLQKNLVIKSQQLFSSHFQELNLLNNAIVNKVRDLISSSKENLVRTNQITINTIIFKNQSAIINLSSNILTKPKILIAGYLNDIVNMTYTIKVFSSNLLKNKKGYLGHYVSIIKMMSPDNILKKGFAIIKLNDKIISDPETIKVGNEVTIIFSQTEIKSIVKSKSKYNGEYNI